MKKSLWFSNFMIKEKGNPSSTMNFTSFAKRNGISTYTNAELANGKHEDIGKRYRIHN